MVTYYKVQQWLDRLDDAGQLRERWGWTDVGSSFEQELEARAWMRCAVEASGRRFRLVRVREEPC